MLFPIKTPWNPFTTMFIYFSILCSPYIDDVPMETSNNTMKTCKIYIKNILKPNNTY